VETGGCGIPRGFDDTGHFIGKSKPPKPLIFAFSENTGGIKIENPLE
jgi:hypothetical protein